jgi:hypothetical protein
VGEVLLGDRDLVEPAPEELDVLGPPPIERT